MKPRVLFVDHAGVLGGGELSLLDIARHYRETSKVVLFEDGPFRTRLIDVGVDVEILNADRRLTQISRGGGILYDLQTVPGIFKLAWQLGRHAQTYDLIYANSQKAMVVAALSGFLFRRPVIWHLRDLMTAEHFSMSHCRVAIGFSNRFVDRVLANSSATRNAYVHCGGSEASTHTVHNGIDSRPFHPADPTELDQIRAELAPGGSPIVAVFSRLAPWKGQHVLIETLQRIPDVHVILVGGALFRDERNYEKKLRWYVNRLGLAHRVHFLGFRDDVSLLMQAVDIVAHTSTAAEPFGRVIVEGMLARKPVIATAAGGALEIIEHMRTGWLVPPADPEALRDAIQTLLEQRHLAEAIGRQGEREARERFSLASMLRKVDRHIRTEAYYSSRARYATTSADINAKRDNPLTKLES